MLRDPAYTTVDCTRFPISAHSHPYLCQKLFENQGNGCEEDSDDDSASAMQNKSFMKWIVDNCNLAELEMFVSSLLPLGSCTCPACPGDLICKNYLPPTQSETEIYRAFNDRIQNLWTLFWAEQGATSSHFSRYVFLCQE